MTTLNNLYLINGGKISANQYDVRFDNGIITDISPSKTTIDNAFYLSRGFIDIHTHGAVGHDVSEASAEALNNISLYLLSNGIVGFLPTFVASPLSELDVSFEKIRQIKVNGAAVLGTHIEGPYISLAKKGAQPEENIRTKFNLTDCKFFEKNKDILKIVTLCPSTDRAVDLVACLSQNGIKSQAGHDDSVDYQIEDCIAKGLDGVTHLYCASSGVRRLPNKINKYLGLNETALYYDDLYAEVIADDIHVPEKLFKFIYKCKGFEKIILVSDSLSPTGAPIGNYTLGNGIDIITDGSVAYLKDKSALAGSVTNIAKMVKNLVIYGIPLAEAVYCASEAPTNYLGISDNYKITVNSAATFNILNKDGTVLKTFLNGIEFIRSNS